MWHQWSLSVCSSRHDTFTEHFASEPLSVISCDVFARTPFWIRRLLDQNSMRFETVSFIKLVSPSWTPTGSLAFLRWWLYLWRSKWPEKESACQTLYPAFVWQKTKGVFIYIYITFSIQCFNILNRAFALHASSEHHFLSACSSGAQHSKLAWISEPAESAWISEQDEQEAEREEGARGLIVERAS